MNYRISLYSNVAVHSYYEFNELYEFYKPYLEPISSAVHIAEDAYAAVFNTWLRYVKLQKNRIICADKMISHQVVEQIVSKMNFQLDAECANLIEKCMVYKDFQFIFSYNITKSLIDTLALFIEKRNIDVSTLKRGYYQLNQDVILEEDPIYPLAKIIASDFVHNELTSETVKLLYFNAIKDTMYTLKQLPNSLKE